MKRLFFIGFLVVIGVGIGAVLAAQSHGINAIEWLESFELKVLGIGF